MAVTRHYFVSDLHLYCKRSYGHRYLDELTEFADNAEGIVLGGDLFDFPWTDRGSVEQSIEEAIGWLDNLVTSAKNCHFYYVLGNHDYNELFIDQLAALSESHINLSWQPFHLRLGNCLFLHGDVADGYANPDELARSRNRWRQAKKKGPVLNRLYDFVVQMNLHRTTCSILYRDHIVTRRLLTYLDAIDAGPDQGIEHVYFGHTHIPLSHHVAHGVTFHNGGAPIQGLEFRIIETVADL